MIVAETGSGHVGAYVVAVFGVLTVVLGWLTRRRLYPALEEPDPQHFPNREQYRRYHLAWVLCLVGGALGGLLVYSIPPATAPAALFHHSAYATSTRWIGPVFVFLGLTLLLWPILTRRMVAKEPLQHLLWDNAAVIGRMDPRPLSLWLGGLAVLAAAVVQFTVRSSHFTITAQGVAWRDSLWHAEQQRAWQDVRRVELVENSIALAGNVVPRPHLRVVFVDGAEAVAGSSVDRPATVWQAAAAILTEHSGVAAATANR